jgi:hypothetical protein
VFVKVKAFQPILKIALGRIVWNVADVLVATGLLITLFAKQEKVGKSKTRFHRRTRDEDLPGAALRMQNGKLHLHLFRKIRPTL